MHFASFPLILRETAMKKLTQEETADMVAKMMLIESIIGTHGLSLELSRLARRLLEEGVDEAVVIMARVAEIRDAAGAITEAKRRICQAERDLEYAQGLLHMEEEDLRFAEEALRELDPSECVDVQEVVDEEVPDEEDDVEAARRH